MARQIVHVPGVGRMVRVVDETDAEGSMTVRYEWPEESPSPLMPSLRLFGLGFVAGAAMLLSLTAVLPAAGSRDSLAEKPRLEAVQRSADPQSADPH
jgi:hypothetical protein